VSRHRDCACTHAFPSRRAIVTGLASAAILPAAARVASAQSASAEDERFMRRCLAEHGREALRGSTLYTSGEPCAMCMGAIIWCHIGRLVFAASIAQLATKIDQIMVTSAEIAEKERFAPITITGGVLAEEALALFGK